MSALDVEIARRLLRDQLFTATGIPAAPLQAWQNRPFETPAPNAGNEWFRETLTVFSEVLEAFEMVTVLGSVTYDVFAPKGQGTETIGDIARNIMLVMRPPRNLIDVPSQCKIHLFRATRGSGRVDPSDPAWFMEPVTVLWRAHVIAPHPS